ncbi:MAG: Flp pilus assembly complex ATPase component TadA [Deltaproteobacteria bacterium]|nr:Flp pilus assembly complex ATPase component TadA [Deltaproteobacteria bacterium]
MAGHIIAVVGGKGGVGKSVFTANLAQAYLMELRQRPLLIDLDLASLGDQNLILGTRSPKTVVEISKLTGGALDLKALQPLMATTASGMSFISAPTDAIAARELDLEGLGKLLKAAPNIFPVVFVDCGSAIESATVKVFEYATMIYMVTTQDVIVVNQTKRAMSRIQDHLFPLDMVQVVLNRYVAASIVSPQVIQKNLNKTLFAAIPDEPETCAGALARSQPFVAAAPQAPITRAFHDVIRKIQQTNVLTQLAALKKPTGAAAKMQVIPGGGEISGRGGGGTSLSVVSKSTDMWTNLKLRIHKGLVETMDLKKQNVDMSDPKQKEALREKTRKAILDILAREDSGGILQNRDQSAQIVKEVLDEALGLGPLEDLLADDAVTEIMVNAREQIFIEKAGKPGLSPITFSSEQQMMNVIERIVSPLGRRCDEKTPYVDARLPDGSRVHVIIPPLALRGPTITIRKFPKKRIGAKELVEWGSMTQEIADFFRMCVEGRLNIIVSGGTGSGKTTLLNTLSNFIPTTERIITVEDAAELQLGQEHVVRLESRPKNIEGEGEVSIRDLVKCCLRMRPDRIVVGECRSGEALDMLQAMNTGHDGSLTTLHANNPRDAIARLETLVMMSGVNMPLKAIREQIASAVNVIIQQSRLSDGSRKVTYVTEVTGIQGEVISLQDIFIFKQESVDKKRRIIGRYVPTGFVPKFVEEMEEKGMKVSRGLFSSAK